MRLMYSCPASEKRGTFAIHIIARYLLILVLSLLLLSSGAGAYAADAGGITEDSRWTTFTSQDGLVGNNVLAIWGDDHAMWFGTDEGISRYDGMRWNDFTAADGLAGNRVQSIWGDGKGAVWFGTSTGLSRYDGAGWHNFTRDDGLSSNNVRDIWGDQQGHVWVVTEPSQVDFSGGVDFYDGTDWHSLWEPARYQHSFVLYGEYSLPSLSVTSTDGGYFASARAVGGDGQGNVWAGHGLALGDGNFLSGGVSCHDGIRWQTLTTTNSGIQDDNINALWVEPGGGLWVGTSVKGVSYFNGQEWQNFGEEAAGKTILAMWGDNRGGIWVGTLLAGVAYYDGEYWQQFTTDDGLASDTVPAVWGDSQGRVWFGTSRGVTCYDPGDWNAFTIEDGLPSNDVQAVWADGAGGVWFGTADAGVACYRAGRWKVYTEQNGLPGNRVTDIWGSRPDDIWVALGSDGAAHFDGFHWQALPQKGALGYSYVYGLWGDGNGTLWFATADGLRRYHNGEWYTFTTRDGLANESVELVTGDTMGNLWVGYRYYALPYDPTRPGADRQTPWPGGVGRYDGHGWTYYSYIDNPAANNVGAIWPDEKGRVWVGWAGDLSYFGSEGWVSVSGGPEWATAIWGDGKGNLWFGSQQTADEGLEAVVSHFDGSEWHNYTTTRDGLASGEIKDIWGDDEGHIWVAHSNLWGGSGGVSFFDGERWEVWGVNNGPVVSQIQALEKDTSGQLWLGTRKGIGVLDGSEWRNFGLQDGLVSLDVEDIWIAKNGEVWVAHALSSVYPEQGGVSRFDGTRWAHYSTSDGLGGNDVNAVWGNNQGTVWTGGWVWENGKEKGWAARFDGSRWETFPLEGGNVKLIWGDSLGTVWFHMTDGINRFDGHEWRYYPSLRSVVETYYADIVRTRGSNPLWAVDSLGQVWIADKNVVTRYNGQAWQSFGSATVLNGEDVRAVLLDGSGCVWVATDGGLSRTDGRTWRSYRVDNSGLGNNNILSILEDTGGHLLFGTDLWYTTYTLSPPDVKIEHLTSLADGAAFVPESEIVLDHNQRSVGIEFSAVAPWTPPRDITYRYRLEGVDATWRFLDNESYTEMRGQVQYPELAPGSYTFTVAAGNRNLDYSLPVSIRFTVHSAPPVIAAFSARVDGGQPLLVEDVLALTPRIQPGVRQVTFSVEVSDDKDAAPLLYYRLDHDGERGILQPVTGAELTLKLEPGSYTLAFTAEDSEGNRSEVTRLISVPQSYVMAWLPLILLGLVVTVGGSTAYAAWRWRTWRRSPAGHAHRIFHQIHRAPSQLLPQLSELLERAGWEGLHTLARLARNRRRQDIAEAAEAVGQMTRPETVVEGLTRLVGWLLQASESQQRNTSVAMWEALLEAIQVRTTVDVVNSAAGLEKALTSQFEAGEEEAVRVLQTLHQVAMALTGAQALPAEKQGPFLNDALFILETKAPATLEGLPAASRLTFQQVVTKWRAVISARWEELTKPARLQCRLLSERLVAADPLTLALEVNNRGQGLASNIRLRILPEVEPVAHIPLLMPGQQEVLEVQVTPQGEQFQVTIEMVYDDREEWGKRDIFSGLVTLHRPPSLVSFKNPYVVGRPPEPDSPVFVGREEIFNFIRSALLEGQHQNVVALVGQRRMGKTSILEQLPKRLGSEVLCVKLDCSGLGTGADTAGLLYEVACTVSETLSEAGLPAPKVDQEAFRLSPGLTFERDILRPAFDILGSRRMLWMLDELEAWGSRAQRGRLDPDVFGFLRHLIQRYEPLALLIVGTQNLYRLSGTGVSPLLNLATTRRLGVLDEKTGQQLVKDPLRDVLFWDELAVTRLLRLAGGHPYFLQAACWLLVEQARADKRGFIGPQDVEASIEGVCELTESHLQELWREGEVLERLMLATLARLMLEQSAASPPEMRDYLAATHSLRLDSARVIQTLDTLVERQVLHRVGELRYAFVVPLFAKWLRDTWPIGALVEEVAHGAV